MILNKTIVSQSSEVFLYIVRVGIGCMFIWSSLPKIRQPYDFLSSVYSYGLAGPKLGMFVAMTLPWMELLVGICLIGGIFIGGALLISIGMATMFSYVLGWRAIVILIASLGAYLCNIFIKPSTIAETITNEPVRLTT